MTADKLAMLSGVLLSLIMSYTPGVSDWYNGLTATLKRVVMAVLIIAVGVAAIGLSCADLIAEIECSRAGAWDLIGAIIAALVANQGMYLISPKKTP